MWIPSESPLRLTLRPTNADRRWLEAFHRESLEQEERDALVDLVWMVSDGRITASSDEIELACELIATMLGGANHKLALDTLQIALKLPWSGVKQKVIQAIGQEQAARQSILQIARTDASSRARRSAWTAVADWPLDDSHGFSRAMIFLGADDPHWRVRLAITDHAVQWANEAAWAEVLERAYFVWQSELQDVGDVARRRVNGVCRHLHFLAEIPCDTEPLPVTVESQTSTLPDWVHDPDPHVAALELRRRRSSRASQWDQVAVALLGQSNDDAMREALRRLYQCRDMSILKQVLSWLADARAPGYEATLKLIHRMDIDRMFALAKMAVCESAPSSIAWGMRTLNELVNADEVDGSLLAKERDRALELLSCGSADVQAAGARLIGALARFSLESEVDRLANSESDTISHWLDTLPATFAIDRSYLAEWGSSDDSSLRIQVARRMPEGLSSWRDLVDDPSPAVRCALARAVLAWPESDVRAEALTLLQADEHSQVRTAAVDANCAAELMQEPQHETSWSVLHRAASVLKAAPATRTLKPEPPSPSPGVMHVTWSDPPLPRVVLPDEPAVAPLGLSGHYQLPEAGFFRALESGVRLMFFEPNYATMYRFFQSLSDQDRHTVQLVAGTFEADPARMETDVDRVLKLLRRDYIDLFLMFWVRDWTRITEDSHAKLEHLKLSGKIRNYSLSTHRLDLAEAALRESWAPVMVRHNAAHRRAETSVLPVAEELKTPIILFNNTCYGQLLGPRSDDDSMPTAADCYRFSLSQPAAAACWMAPSTLDQLDENLDVLTTLELPEDRRAALLERGKRVRALDQAVRKNLRIEMA